MSSTRIFGWLVSAALSLVAMGVHAQTAKAPDALIKEISSDVLDSVKADKTIQAGDVRKVIALVDQKVLPYVNFERMTASAVGRYWRQATPEQQKRLQDEFKLLLVRTYSGALSQVSPEQTVELKPMRSAAGDSEVVVRTEIRGKGDPIQLDYRLEKAGAGWKIYDVNVMGVWLVENYRNALAGNPRNGNLRPIAKLADAQAPPAGCEKLIVLLLRPRSPLEPGHDAHAHAGLPIERVGRCFHAAPCSTSTRRPWGAAGDRTPAGAWGLDVRCRASRPS